MSTLTESSKPVNPMAQVLRHRDFRLLWLGQATSLVGDQFALIAMPWLVLQLTLGRLMSLLLFASVGLLPLSQALSGAVSRWSLTGLFMGTGVLMMFVAAWTAFQPAFTQVDAVLEES